VQRLHASGQPAAPVLCADTTVALGAQILGKPRDAREAARMLRLLSGQTHRVITAVAVQAGKARHEAVSDSRVRFARLTPRDVAAYVASGEWQGKAGGYAIQGRAAAFIEHISGSYSGIMGLPLHETALLLRFLSPRPLGGEGQG
jgi:septum formation protein